MSRHELTPNLLNEQENNHQSKNHKKTKNLSIHPTEDPDQKDKIKNNTSINFGIIKMNLNDIKNYIPQDSNQTLKNYTFEEANKYDRRSIFKIFYIYLLSKQIIFHTFFLKNPFEVLSLRIFIFIFILSTDLALNALLYLNDNISKKYKYAKGLFLFTFSNNITVIIYSTLLSFFMLSLITKLSNSTNSIRNIFREEEKKIQTEKNYIIDEERKNKIFLEIEKILKKYKIKILFLIIVILIIYIR